jgi:hypothetical protein
LLVLHPDWTLADSVVPSADVTTGVIVHVSASSQSAPVGTLRPGESAELVFGRRFELRAQALQWADLERQQLERDGWHLAQADGVP